MTLASALPRCDPINDVAATDERGTSAAPETLRLPARSGYPGVPPVRDERHRRRRRPRSAGASAARASASALCRAARRSRHAATSASTSRVGVTTGGPPSSCRLASMTRLLKSSICSRTSASRVSVSRRDVHLGVFDSERERRRSEAVSCSVWIFRRIHQSGSCGSPRLQWLACARQIVEVAATDRLLDHDLDVGGTVRRGRSAGRIGSADLRVIGSAASGSSSRARASSRRRRSRRYCAAASRGSPTWCTSTSTLRRSAARRRPRGIRPFRSRHTSLGSDPCSGTRTAGSRSSAARCSPASPRNCCDGYAERNLPDSPSRS